MSAPACHERGETRIRWTPRPDGLEESVQFTPGYNCPVPGGPGHGVHGMEITWLLRGPKGAVSLGLSTDWIPGKRSPGHGLPPYGPYDGWLRYPNGMGVMYHARAPKYEGHEPAGDCCLIDGPCYYDRWFGGADEAVKRFVAEGEQVIWDVLEDAYADLDGAP